MEGAVDVRMDGWMDGMMDDAGWTFVLVATASPGVLFSCLPLFPFLVWLMVMPGGSHVLSEQKDGLYSTYMSKQSID